MAVPNHKEQLDLIGYTAKLTFCVADKDEPHRESS